MPVDHSAVRRTACVLLAALGTAAAGCGSSGSASSSSSAINDGHDWDQASVEAKADAVATCRRDFGSDAQPVGSTQVRDRIERYYGSSVHEKRPFNTACLEALKHLERKVSVHVSHGTDATVTADSYTMRGTVKPANARIALRYKDVGSARVTRHGSSFAIVTHVTAGHNGFQIRATAPGYQPFSTGATITRKQTPEEIAAEQAQEKADFEGASSTIAYGELEKAADAHRGEKVKVYGQVFQIQQVGNRGIMLVSVTNEGYDVWDDNVWVDYTGKIPQVEGDLITLYGTITGSKSYQTQIGGETYVPRVRAKYIDGT